MFYLLFYEVVADFVSRRAAFREQHLSHARAAHARGELLLAGAYADPIDGAALAFRANDRAVVERFAQEDPYVREGLVTHWHVRQWSVVIGDDLFTSTATAQ